MAQLSGLNRNTVNRYLRRLRERIAVRCEQESPFVGTVEVDESHFGARRVKGKRGRGACDKMPVFRVVDSCQEFALLMIKDSLFAAEENRMNPPTFITEVAVDHSIRLPED